MPEIIDSYTTGSEPISVGAGKIYKSMGQSFTGKNLTAYSSKFNLIKVGSPTGNATANIYSHTGTYGTNSLPDALLVTSATLDVSTLTTSFAWIELLYPSTLSLSTSYYVTTLEYNDGDAANYIEIGEKSASPTHDGNEVRQLVSGTWQVWVGRDLGFEVWGSTPISTLSGVSTIQGISQITL